MKFPMVVDMPAFETQSNPSSRWSKRPFDIHQQGLIGKTPLLKWALIALSICVTGIAKADQNLPAYKGHVNDYANVLSPAQVKELDERLFAYEDSTSSQIAVVIEPSANGLAAIDRAMFLARGWGVGQKNKNNGILLYIAINDRKFFTVTADQMQDKLGASRLGQIENDFLVPNLRNQDYFNAILQTTQAFEQALMGKFKGKATRKHKSGARGYVGIFITIIILIIISRGGGGGGYRRNGRYNYGFGAWPLFMGGFGGGFGGGSSGGFGGGFGGGSSDWGGFGGGGGFNGGGAGGSW
jgi:uncharacterized protein